MVRKVFKVLGKVVKIYLVADVVCLTTIGAGRVLDTIREQGYTSDGVYENIWDKTCESYKAYFSIKG